MPKKIKDESWRRSLRSRISIRIDVAFSVLCSKILVSDICKVKGRVMKKRSSRRVAALAVAAVIALGSHETAMAGETSRSLFRVFHDLKKGDVRSQK